MWNAGRPGPVEVDGRVPGKAVFLLLRRLQGRLSAFAGVPSGELRPGAPGGRSQSRRQMSCSVRPPFVSGGIRESRRPRSGRVRRTTERRPLSITLGAEELPGSRLRAGSRRRTSWIVGIRATRRTFCPVRWESRAWEGSRPGAPARGPQIERPVSDRRTALDLVPSRQLFENRRTAEARSEHPPLRRRIFRREDHCATCGFGIASLIISPRYLDQWIWSNG